MDKGEENKITLPKGVSEAQFRNLLLNFLDKKTYKKALRGNLRYKFLLREHKLAVASVRKVEERRNKLWADICQVRKETWNLVTQYRKGV